MPPDWLRITAYCVYLASWLVAAVVALTRALPRLQRRLMSPARLSASEAIGMLIQATSALPITLTLTDGPLRPSALALMGTIAFAVLGVAVLCWAFWSVPSDPASAELVTRGAYRWLRHPIYLAFLAMLIATGLVASAGPATLIAVVLYVVGTELRIPAEEADLEQRFPSEYPGYRSKTRWRYVPGLR